MPAPHYTPPVLPKTPALPADGIHFNMPFEDYLAAPAVGSGMALDALRDELTAWEGSWLNPYKEEEETDAQLYGKAHHALILEGRDAFDERYIVMPDKRDFEELCVTVDDIKKALEENGIVPRKGAKPVLLAQMAEELPDVPVWDNIIAQVEKDADGRSLIKADWWQKFDRARLFIDRDPDLQALLEGGYSEVSLFWHCPYTGIPKKARIDKLQLRRAIDMKTFANMYDKPLVRGDEPGGALTQAIANHKYPFQTSWYLEGINIVQYLVRMDAAKTVHIHGEAPVVEFDDIMDFTRVWCGYTGTDEEPEDNTCGWTWLFVQKGKAPSVAAVEYDVEDMVREQFDMYVQQASELIRACFDDFGAEQWARPHGVLKLDSRKLPPYVLEI